MNNMPKNYYSKININGEERYFKDEEARQNIDELEFVGEEVTPRFVGEEQTYESSEYTPKGSIIVSGVQTKSVYTQLNAEIGHSNNYKLCSFAYSGQTNRLTISQTQVVIVPGGVRESVLSSIGSISFQGTPATIETPISPYGSIDTITPKGRVEVANYNLEKVIDASELNVGDHIVILSEQKVAAAGPLDGNRFMSSVEVKFNHDKTLAHSLYASVITLAKEEEGIWILKTDEGDLFVSSNKSMNVQGQGTGTWTIDIDEETGDATIASTEKSFGKILYNSQSPRFLNYTADPSTSMPLPQIYKVVGEPTRRSSTISSQLTENQGSEIEQPEIEQPTEV